jgi:hypothetical protein
MKNKLFNLFHYLTTLCCTHEKITLVYKESEIDSCRRCGKVLDGRKLYDLREGWRDSFEAMKEEDLNG